MRAGGSGVGLDGGPDIELFILVGWGRGFFVRCLARRGSAVGFLFLRCFGGVVWRPGGLRVSVVARFCRVLVFVSSWCLSVVCLFPVMVHWWVGGPSCGPSGCVFRAMTEAGGGVGCPWGRFKPLGAVLLLWFLTVTCSCCLCLYFGSAIVLVICFVDFGWLNGRLFGRELFIRFAAGAFRKLLSVCVLGCFPFGFEAGCGT